MPVISALSNAEFASLTLIASGPLLDPSIPESHLLNLKGLGYIEVLHGRFQATVSGLFRVASGT
jgi:hypothetical protein